MQEANNEDTLTGLEGTGTLISFNLLSIGIWNACVNIVSRSNYFREIQVSQSSH